MSSLNRRRTRSKYNAIRTEVDGIIFASKKEANNFLTEMMLEGKTDEDFPTAEICELERK